MCGFSSGSPKSHPVLGHAGELESGALPLVELKDRSVPSGLDCTGDCVMPSGLWLSIFFPEQDTWS